MLKLCFKASSTAQVIGLGDSEYSCRPDASKRWCRKSFGPNLLPIRHKVASQLVLQIAVSSYTHIDEDLYLGRCDNIWH